MEVESEDKEELFKSNPLPNKKENLGYNPISNNKGSGGNTAQESKDNKDNLEEDYNDNLDIDNVEKMDKFDEVYNLNSMLESVWQQRPNMRLDKKNKSLNQIEAERNTQSEENIENNFNFLQKPEEIEDDNNMNTI